MTGFTRYFAQVCPGTSMLDDDSYPENVLVRSLTLRLLA